MFSFRLRNAAQERRFLISDSSPAGWEVREELDSQVLTRRQYLDWHRVERARRAFERQIVSLRQDGWVEG